MRTCSTLYCALLAGLALLWCTYTASAQRVRPTDSLSVHRIGHQSQPLENGRVIVFGGQTTDELFRPVVHSSCEIFDPATETWTPASAMNTARADFASVVLQDGRILAIGGADSQDRSLASVERYDPATDTWTHVGTLRKERQNISAVLLDNGNVLVMGHDPNSFEIGSADGSGWNLYEDESLGYAYPESPRMIRMNDARILVVGNQAGPYPNRALTITQQGTADTTAFPAIEDHPGAGLALLPDGKVLVTGGTASAKNELFDPAAETFTATDNFSFAHFGCPLMPLSDGRIAAVNAGSTVYPDDTYILEIYTPSNGQWEVMKAHDFTATDNHTATPLGNGKYLISGGRQLSGLPGKGSNKCFIFDETTVGVREEQPAIGLVRYDESSRCIHIQMQWHGAYSARLLDIYDRAHPRA